jgi:hypothetical protein
MRTLIAAGLVLGLVGLGVAQDKKNDPTGTWKVTTTFGDQKRESTLKLKLDGDKVTGTWAGAGKGGQAMEAKVEDGKFKDGQLTFTITREFNEQKFTSKYNAKVEGDTMKGTIKAMFGEKEFEQEFEAKREKGKD